jgi:hypothetical protein
LTNLPYVRLVCVLLVGLAGVLCTTEEPTYGSFLDSEARLTAEVLMDDRPAFVGDIERSLRVGVAFLLGLRPPSTPCRQLMILSEDG